MVSFLELNRRRIETKGVQHDDIKHADLLTSDEIAAIPVENVYMWVKTGKWKQRDFKKWLKVLWVIE
jgi:hypothetical protein